MKNSSSNTSGFNQMIYSASKSLKIPAMKFTRNADEANDLIQDTILKALKNKDKFQTGTNIKAWMYIIMKNTFISNYHKDGRYSNIDTKESDYVFNDLQTNNEGNSNLNMEIILKAIKKLEKQYRIPFIMHYEGFKYEEISQQMAIPMGTVKNRIHVARQFLMSELKDFKN